MGHVNQPNLDLLVKSTFDSLLNQVPLYALCKEISCTSLCFNVAVQCCACQRNPRQKIKLLTDNSITLGRLVPIAKTSVFLFSIVCYESNYEKSQCYILKCLH